MEDYTLRLRAIIGNLRNIAIDLSETSDTRPRAQYYPRFCDIRKKLFELREESSGPMIEAILACLGWAGKDNFKEKLGEVLNIIREYGYQ